MKKLMLALPLIAAAPLIAQGAPQAPGAVDPARVKAGTYKIDNHHAQIAWTVNHFGFNDYYGIFGQPTGTLVIDPKKPDQAKVSVTIPIAEVATSRPELNKHLMSGEFFNATKFPTATFISTKVEVSGSEARITGNLTMLGVTKPVTLAAKFAGAGTNPMSSKSTIGFHATGTIKRSEWGMTKFIPFVGDEVGLRISVAFEREG